MNLNEWRRQRAPVAEQLPSGLNVRLKRVSMESLAFSGLIPAALLSQLGEQKNGKVEMDVGKLLESITEFVPLLDAFATSCIVEVQAGESDGEPVWQEVADCEFDPATELDQRDKLHILSWSQIEVAALKPFPEGDATG